MLDTNKPQARKSRHALLRALSYLPGGMLLAPLGFLVFRTLSLAPDLLRHVSETLLVDSIINTSLLLSGVVGLSLILGTASAWLLARFEFPLAQFWRWALLLPLAIPAYVVSFVWISWMDFSGLVPSLLREHFGMTETPALFANFRSLPGILAPLALSMFPYVYLLMLEGFETQNRSFSEAARSLGLGRVARFWRLHIPMMTPWILSGVLLVGMETLADFGSVSVFNIQVFTTLVYRSWFALQSLETASFFAVIHVLFLGVFVFVVSRFSGRKRFSDSFAGRQTRGKRRLSRMGSVLANFGLMSLWLLAFALPVAQLLHWTLATPTRLWDFRLLERILNSFGISLLVALTALLFALILLVARRVLKGHDIAWAQRIGILGYGIPGTVIAVGWMASLSILFGSLQSLAWVALLALVLGLSTRFLALAHRPLVSASERISPSIEESSMSSGMTLAQTLRRIHFPLMKNAFGIALIFVFIDTLKEMPMTILMRPYGWDTLAVRVYQYTSDGLFEEAAAPSLVIVLASVLPILFMRRSLR